MRPRDSTDPLIRSLLNPAIFGSATAAVNLIETHISWVLLTGELAFKIKKPVKLPFLDFTTLEARRRYCEEELRLNRRLAPELYLAVVPIGGTREAPRLSELPAIEYAVKMCEFPADARLDRRLAAGAVGSADIARFAELIGGFHAGLSPAPADSGFGTASRIRTTVEKNIDETANALPGSLGLDRSIRDFMTRRGRELGPTLERRAQRGAIREGHGDLHLENLVYWRNAILPFDALEFDPALRWLDVMDESAFVTMDLMAHGRADLAYVYLNRYLEVTGDYSGLAVLDYYLIHRALVRAKVSAIKSAQTGDAASAAADRYLGLAHRLIEARRPVLVMTHGLSGSGKTTLTEQLIPSLPAVRLRSDIERKRLTGITETERSHSPIGGGIYSAQLTEATYDRLARCAEVGLRAGLNVIVDAAFLEHSQRRLAADVAHRAGSGFVIVDCIAPLAVLRDRVEARHSRGRDASEGTLEVLEHQLATRDELSPVEREQAIRVDTTAIPFPDHLAERILDT